MTQVSEAMTRSVRSISPDDSLVAAAQAMEELDVGVLPVCDGEELIGVVTDRDIVVRGVAQECPLDETTVMDVMTEDTVCCFEDDTIEDVQAKMREAQIRRVPVVDKDRHLVGMLSLADLANRSTPHELGETISEISQPGNAS
ncbi:MAG: CBS domain-containing protein [Aquabacterium sp.]